MKRILFRMISVILSLTLLLCYLPMFAVAVNVQPKYAANPQTTEWKNGDIGYMGEYPRSKVTDQELLIKLNSQHLEWISYDYYYGKGWDSYGSMTSGNWMQYADISYDGCKYRAVLFSKYRPYETIRTSTTNDSKQDDNGYGLNTVYWFKYEPIAWKILDSTTGLAICDEIIDSQAFSDSIYYSETKYGYYHDIDYINKANNYESSSIRSWLDNSFFLTAFTDSEKEAIKKTTLENRSYYSEYNCVSTVDRVFLLSEPDLDSSNYGFCNCTGNYSSNLAYATNYAACQGVSINSVPQIYYSGCSPWILRTSGKNGSQNYYVEDSGSVAQCNVDMTCYGIRPAVTIQLNSDEFKAHKCEISGEHTYVTTSNNDGTHSQICSACGQKISSAVCTYIDTITQPTCTEKGYTTHKCTECGYSYVDSYTDKTDHIWDQGTVTARPSCTSNGTKTFICSVCGATKTEQIAKIPHSPEIIPAVPATYSTDGLTEGSKCSVCGEILVPQTVTPKLKKDDTIKPTGFISSTNDCTNEQTVTLAFSDNVGISGFYWGKNSDYLKNSFTSTSDTKASFVISTQGTYYLVVKDTEDNCSDESQITFVKSILDANGGTVSPTYIVTAASKKVVLPTITRNNYSFLGWATSPNADVGTAAINPTSDNTYYALWKTSYAKQLKYDSLHFSFSNSLAGLGYSSGYKIPLASYQFVFGNTSKSKSLFNDSTAWGGSCFGFSSSSMLLNLTGEDLATNDLNSAATTVSALKCLDANKYSVRTILEAMQVSQYTNSIQSEFYYNGGKIDNLTNEVKNTGGVVVCVFGKIGNCTAGHAVVAYKIEKKDASTDLLCVYDPNYPDDASRCITLTKNDKGKYTGWYYKLNNKYDWGNGYGGHISYVSYSTLASVWTNRGQSLNSNTNLLMVNSSDVSVFDANGELSASYNNGEFSAYKDDVFQYVNIGVPLGSDENNYSAANGFILPTGEYTVINNNSDHEKLHLSMINVDMATDIDTTASSVKLFVSDEDGVNIANIVSAGNDSYYATMYASGKYCDTKQDNDGDGVVEYSVNSSTKNGKITCIGVVAQSVASSSDGIESSTMTFNSTDSAQYNLICYDINGGSTTVPGQKKTAAGSIKLSSVIPVREGYKFIGWSVNKDASTVDYHVEDTYSDDSDLVLYAVWKSDTSGILGDIDGDGTVTVADARFALRISVGLERPTENQKTLANVDFDDNVTSADARLILRAAVGLERLKK